MHPTFYIGGSATAFDRGPASRGALKTAFGGENRQHAKARNREPPFVSKSDMAPQSEDGSRAASFAVVAAARQFSGRLISSLED